MGERKKKEEELKMKGAKQKNLLNKSIKIAEQRLRDKEKNKKIFNTSMQKAQDRLIKSKAKVLGRKIANRIKYLPGDLAPRVVMT